MHTYEMGFQIMESTMASRISNAAMAAKITLTSVVSVIVINCTGRF